VCIVNKISKQIKETPKVFEIIRTYCIIKHTGWQKTSALFRPIVDTKDHLLELSGVIHLKSDKVMRENKKCS